ncbi:MAG: hypothetical protein LBF72_01140 [Holosporales bacterium]|jgi:cell division transport system permease protein|nr:hypothetical protein [Holosporales bacterium]
MNSFFSFKPFALAQTKNKGNLLLIFVFFVFLLSFVVACTWIFTKGVNSWSKSNNAFKYTIEIPAPPLLSSQPQVADAQQAELLLQNTDAPAGAAQKSVAAGVFGGVAQKSGATGSAPLNAHSEKVRAIIEKLRKFQDVSSVSHVEPDKLRAMLASWAGESEISRDFLLPTLLDVSFKKVENIGQITQQLRAIAPDIVIESHSLWSEKLTTFGRSFGVSAFLIGCFILLCEAIIISLITKSSLQAYFATLDILRLMGARDSYIANIFQTHVLKAAAKGGSIGFCLSLPVIYILYRITERLGMCKLQLASTLLPLTGTLFAVAVVVVLLSVIVSRLTILSHLKNLDAYTFS